MKLSNTPFPEDRNKEKVRQSHDMNQYRRKFFQKVDKVTSTRKVKVKK